MDGKLSRGDVFSFVMAAAAVATSYFTFKMLISAAAADPQKSEAMKKVSPRLYAVLILAMS